MRITKIKINNFKSLVDFEIDLSKFNCIIGLNGSGKSTFLQFMSFLSQLMRGDIGNWLQQRKWGKEDIVPELDGKKHRSVRFEVFFQREPTEGCWKGQFWVDQLYCIKETLSIGDCSFDAANTKNEKTYTLSGRSKADRINFNYQGSIFSQLADKEVSDRFGELIQFFRNIRAFDLLSPYFLKQDSKAVSNTIGFWGENIAPFLHGMESRVRASVIGKIKQVYPEFNSFDTLPNPDGSKSLNIREQYYNGNIVYSIPARGINDGLLRILAMLGQLNMDDPFLLFDEIENGINQELVDFLLQELIGAKQQIAVTTHSPLFLNYLDDELAKDSVHYFYKTPEGFTRCRKFFSLPSTSKKLGTLGPGEAIADTNLYRLNEEIELLERNAGKEN